MILLSLKITLTADSQTLTPYLQKFFFFLNLFLFQQGKSPNILVPNISLELWMAKREALFLPFTPTYTTSFIVSFGWKKQTAFSCLRDQNRGKLQESSKLKTISTPHHILCSCTLIHTINICQGFIEGQNKFARCLLILACYKLDNLGTPCELDIFSSTQGSTS